MAKVQIVFAMTIDGYFPDDDRLMEWIREDRNGFLLWKQHSTFSIAPDYPMVDLICFKDTTSSDSIFQAIISEREDTEILRRLSVYHLPDEIVIYMLPVISGHGIRISDFLDSCSWNLHSSKSFRNGICRLIIGPCFGLYHNETCCATRCKKWNYYTKNRIHYDTDRQGDIPDDAPSDNGTV